MKKIDLEDQIEQFLEKILPDNASQIQINETRKAFVSGMYQSYINIMAISNEEDKTAAKILDDYCNSLTNTLCKYIK